MNMYEYHKVACDWLCLLLSARRAGSIGLQPSRASSGNLARIRSASGVSSEAGGGGLSVTGSLSNFSLYIFHPYGGGGQKKTSLAALENTFRKGTSRTGWRSVSAEPWISCTANID